MSERACECRGIDEAPGCHHGALHWEAVRGSGRGRPVIYRRYTTGPERKESRGAVARRPEGVRALLYDWTTGNAVGTELGYFKTEREAKRAVEEAVGLGELCSTCGQSFDSPPCSLNRELGWSGHTRYGGAALAERHSQA